MSDRAYILLPQMAISAISWIQLLLSMNKFRGVTAKRVDAWALLLRGDGGLVRWVAAAAMRTSTLAQRRGARRRARSRRRLILIVFERGRAAPVARSSAGIAMSAHHDAVGGFQPSRGLVVISAPTTSRKKNI